MDSATSSAPPLEIVETLDLRPGIMGKVAAQVASNASASAVVVIAELDVWVEVVQVLDSEDVPGCWKVWTREAGRERVSRVSESGCRIAAWASLTPPPPAAPDLVLSLSRIS